MSKLSDLRARISGLTEIQSIFSAMKNLATIEMNKVSKLMVAQKKSSATVDAAIADFEFFFGRYQSAPRSSASVLCVLIGSERGFCGPFNEKVIAKFRAATTVQGDVKIALIGQKLAMKMGRDPRVVLQMNGPNSADEISVIINEMARQLLPYVNFRWMFVQNVDDDVGHREVAFFPLEVPIECPSSFLGSPPGLNIPAEELFPQLMEQHLFSIMHRALDGSFLAENRERLRHMEGALQQIEKKRAQLLLKLNSQRQEEITEELEILMLSSSQASGDGIPSLSHLD